DLIVDVEAMNVVVHRVEEMETRTGTYQPHHLPAHEEPARGRGRAVELHGHRRAHLSRVEEGPTVCAIGEAGSGQIDPACVVELPAGTSPSRRQVRGGFAPELGRLPREARHPDAGVHEEA